MTKAIEFFGVLANIEHGSDKNTVLDTLTQEIDDFHLFKKVLEPGVIYATTNWQGVLGRSAEVAAIASLLWSIYVHKVEPLLDKKDQLKPALIIQLKDSEGNWEGISIDGSYQDKEVFIQEFTEKVERFRVSDDEDEIVLERMERSKRWIKIQ